MSFRGIKNRFTLFFGTCCFIAIWTLFGHQFSLAYIEYSRNWSAHFDHAGLEIQSINQAAGIEKLVIATIACSANKNDDTIYQETAVMLKSVVLSSDLHNVKQIVFYIFLEYPEKWKYFENKFKDYGLSSNGSFISVYFRKAVNVVPAKYRKHMIYHPVFRCSYVRSFFPTALPKEDAVLYLDTDVIITGDISKIWSLFYKMKGEQLIGIGNNNELEDRNFQEMDKRLFGDIPHVQPKGVNNGVILMNLTKMREYKWEDKFTRLYDAYSKVVKRMTVQRLMNILLFYNPGLLYVIRCEFHFIHTHCSKGLTCKYIHDDPTGIHLIHGANNTFADKKIFQHIFETYNKFNLSHGNVLEDLVIPIIRFYESTVSSPNPCNKVLSENLFKDM